MTWRAAIGACERVLSRLHIIYVPPLLCETIIMGLRYWGCIFQLSAFSIAVLQIKTKLPCLKSKSQIVARCSHLKWICSFVSGFMDMQVELPEIFPSFLQGYCVSGYKSCS